MARSPVAIAVGLALALLTLGTAAVVLAQGRPHLTAPDWAAVRFTLLQATLSALASTSLAIPVARALSRRRFTGRNALVTLMGAPFLLPVIVAIIGLLGVFGRAGILNQTLQSLGLPTIQIYGLHGVILAHVFLNLPLATRMILQGWQAIPSERLRLAASLGFPPIAVARHLELPMLRSVIPGALITIFVICLTSFAVALTLGGGPKATTVELAIYQSLRFDFDLGRAASLAAVQFALCATTALIAWRIIQTPGFGAGLDRGYTFAPTGWHRIADTMAITLSALFLLVPLAMVAVHGVAGLPQLPPSIWPATLRSIAIAIPSALLATAAALALALAVAKDTIRWLDLAALLPLATSGLVLGTGLFLIVQPWTSPSTIALPVTLIVNAALALPFVYRLILPDAQALHRDYARLAQSLNINGPAQLFLIILPRLSRPIGFGLGLAVALSMGDLGVIALFAGDAQATLPLTIQRLTAAYKLDAAASASLILVTISFALFAICDWGGRHVAPD
jgi:thiamine transport system permease protein